MGNKALNAGAGLGKEGIMMKLIEIKEIEALSIAEKMCVTSHSDEEKFVTHDRLKNIEEELKDTAYKCVNTEEGNNNVIFKMYAKKPIGEIEGRILLVSSHADCLQRGKVFEKEMPGHPERMLGIFDNAITNAACVYLMKHCDIPENVVFAFTGDEENKQNGAKEVCKYLNKKFPPVRLKSLVLMPHQLHKVSEKSE